MKDIFDDLKKAGRCGYVSDLRHGVNPSLAKAAISKLKLEEYELSQISELATYVYAENVEFKSFDEAKEYFAKK